MDIFAVIEEDHNQVSALFKKLTGTQGAGAREALFAELKENLETHSHAEEQVVYAALKAVDATRDIALEALEDHQLVADLLQELAAMPQETQGWHEKLQVLQETVQMHVEEEESEIFASARQVLSTEQLEALHERWEEAKTRQKVPR